MLNDLADYLNISPKYCGIVFKQLSDNKFKDFLNRYRIDRSKEILEQDPSIKIVDLSAMVGFNSSNSFIRVFNKYVGITPKAYQDRMRESHWFILSNYSGRRENWKKNPCQACL